MTYPLAHGIGAAVDVLNDHSYDDVVFTTSRDDLHLGSAQLLRPAIGLVEETYPVVDIPTYKNESRAR